MHRCDKNFDKQNSLFMQCCLLPSLEMVHLCPVTHSCLLFLFQTIETYRMVDLPCSSVLSTPSSITVTISVVTARLCLCLCGHHTLSTDRYASTHAGAHSNCLLCISHCEANNVVISQAGINAVNVGNNR